MVPSTDVSVALITGANQGIGFETAKLLSKTKPDYRIILGARDAKKGEKAVQDLNSEGCANVEFVVIDVTDDGSIERAAKEVETRYGVLDVLINNAGINNEFPDEKMSSFRDRFKQAYEVNVFGAAQVTETFTSLLEKSEHARIVFVSSHTGSITLRLDPNTKWYERMHKASFPIYRSSKAALNMLTLHYKDKFPTFKVNASCPNLTATNFSRGNGRHPSESAKNSVRLATLAVDGQTGTLSDEDGLVPW